MSLSNCLYSLAIQDRFLLYKLYLNRTEGVWFPSTSKRHLPSERETSSGCTLTPSRRKVFPEHRFETPLWKPAVGCLWAYKQFLVRCQKVTISCLPIEGEGLHRQRGCVWKVNLLPDVLGDFPFARRCLKTRCL